MNKESLYASSKGNMEQLLEKDTSDLLNAVKNNNFNILENLIKNGGGINTKDKDNRTLLHYSVNNCNIDIVKLLLKHGADVKEITNNGNTVLHTAANKGSKEIVLALLQHVKKEELNDFINARTTSGGNTSLHVAAKKGFLEIVEMLLKHGAIYDIQNRESKTPLDLSENQNVSDILKLVAELFEDARNGNMEVISKLKSINDFSVVTNARNKQGNTLLQVALAYKHRNIGRELIEVLKDPDLIQIRNLELDQLENLKYYAERHIKFSDIYLPFLRSHSRDEKPYEGSEKNPSPWYSLKEGSYYLGNAFDLVNAYKDCGLRLMDNKSIQALNESLVDLEFDRKHMSNGYTDEAYGGKARCFVSNGQGTKYYNILHSDLKKDVRYFISMVERNIDIPVKKFLATINQRLLLAYSKNLFEAVKKENCLDVEKFIEKKGVDINLKDSEGRTPLHYAANIGNINIVKLLLKHGADVTEITNNGNTVLHTATNKGSKEIVLALLQNVKKEELNDFINRRTSSGGNTSLHVAAKKGFLEIVDMLLKHGAIYDIQNREDKTPLDLSENQNVSDILKLVAELFEDARNGNMEVISKLKSINEFSAVTNARNKQGNTLLQVALANKHRNIGRELIEVLKDPDLIQIRNLELDQLEKLKYYAERHIEFSDIYLPYLRSHSWDEKPYEGSEKNLSPWYSLKEGSYYLGNAFDLVNAYKDCGLRLMDNKSIQALNESLVDLEFDRKHMSTGYTDEAYGGTTLCFVSNGQGTKYYNILHSDLKKDVRYFISMVERNIDIPVKKFLATINQRLLLAYSKNLFEAVKKENCLDVEKFIEKGVDINLKDSEGRTPLHYAANIGNINIVKLLLKHGADLAEITNNGNTALHTATNKGSKEIVLALLQNVKKEELNDFINRRTSSGGNTSLHIAAKKGFLEIVDMLLKHGAIYDIQNREDKTPLDLSENQNVTDLLKLVAELFEDARNGNMELIRKLKSINDFSVVTNARNKQGNTLFQVVTYFKHKKIKNKLLKILNEQNRNSPVNTEL